MVGIQSEEYQVRITRQVALLVFAALALLGGGARSWAAPTHPERQALWVPMLRVASEVAQGRMDEALRIVSALAQPSEDQTIATATAMCRLVLGDEMGAHKDLQRATRAGGTHLEAHYWLAVVALRRGQVAEARQALHHALTLAGDRPNYLMLQAMLFRRTGQPALARDALGRLAQTHCDLLDPGLYPDPMVGLAEALVHLLRDFPQPGAALITAGNLLWASKRFRQAEHFFKRAGRVMSDHPAVLLRLAQVALVDQDAPEALRVLSRAIAKDPEDPELRASRAEAYLLLGRVDEAHVDLAKAVKGNPKEALPLARLADIHWSSGGYEQAELFYRYSLARHQGLASARFGLARAYARRGLDDKAAESFRAATALNPANERYHLAYALHLEKMEKPIEAARVRTRAAAARGLTQKLAAKVGRARREGGPIRSVCRMAEARALEAAAVMERRLSAPPAVRAFLRAHLARKAGRQDLAAQAMAAAGLRPERLISTGAEPPTVLSVKGEVDREVPVVLLRYLTFVDPARLR